MASLVSMGFEFNVALKFNSKCPIVQSLITSMTTIEWRSSNNRTRDGGSRLNIQL